MLKGTAVAIGGRGVLLRGASGSGKSDLALRLIGGGARLIADDCVLIDEAGLLSPPPTIGGFIEVRGVGIRRVPGEAGVPLALIVDLVPSGSVERLPDPSVERHRGREIPVIRLDPFEPSAPLKVGFALERDEMERVDPESGASPSAAILYNDGMSGEAEHSSGSTGPSEPARVVLITGMSGAGRSTALKLLEDMGYEAVDNLPLSLLPRLVGSAEADHRPIAVGIDIRTRDFAVENLLQEIERLASSGHLGCRLVFLDCDDDTLVRRFTETRRRHPLAIDRPVTDGVRLERRLVSPLRDRANLTIDTSILRPPQLRQVLDDHFGLAGGRRLSIFVTSFSYRAGLPRNADLVFDVRFLNNPHYDPALRELTGLDPEVATFIGADPGLESFFQSLIALLGPLLPRYDREGKSYLTLAVGCTGGRHRSVFIAERLADWLRGLGQAVTVSHRDLPPAGPPRVDPPNRETGAAAS